METSIRPIVRYWLLAGVVMVFFQVVIGGITRLTDSGLSITEWAVIQGTLPPLNQAEWEEAFDAYKVAARKQFETLHADMTLQEFKVIFFWEYIHRLWARMMGLVFLLPFLFFWSKKMIPAWMMRRLGLVILLASLAAAFGWIMVASGLNDDSRTWVSAYKLIIHLLIATVLFGVLFWTWMLSHGPPAQIPKGDTIRRWGWGLTALLLLQIALGGLMAGMRAGLIHPHFPLFINGSAFLKALSGQEGASIGEWVNYEASIAVKAWVQLVHRTMAWILSGLILFLLVKIKRWNPDTLIIRAAYLIGGVLVFQFLLGILTVINSIGFVPVFYGVLHQAGALALLAAILYLVFLASARTKHEL